MSQWIYVYLTLFYLPKNRIGQNLNILEKEVL